MDQRFHSIKEVGEGAWGKVFYAETAEGPRALKFLKVDAGPDRLRQFQAEARILSKLSHPNLVRIHDYFSSLAEITNNTDQPSLFAGLPQNSCGFSMDWIEGPSLDQFPAGLAVEEIIDVLVQAAAGLNYLHFRNIFHRDLKPANILRDTTGRIKIVDFGLSLESPARRHDSALVGSLAYTPPEAFMGDFGASGDLFALGATIYRVVSGQLPFDRPLTPLNLDKVSPPIALATLAPAIPEFLSQIIAKLLELSPLKRPASALLLLKYLRRHVGKDILDSKFETAEFVIPKLPLIGREEELTQMSRALFGDDNSTPLFLLSGPTGVGRSRFLEELRWRSIFRGRRFLEVRAEAKLDWRSGLARDLGIRSDEVELRDMLAFAARCRETLRERASILAFGDFHQWPKRIREEFRIFWNLLLLEPLETKILVEFNSDLWPLAESSAWIQAQDLPFFSLNLENLTEAQTQSLLQEASAGREWTGAELERLARSAGGRPLLALEGLRSMAESGFGAVQFKSDSFAAAARAKISELSEGGQVLLALLLTETEAIDFDDFSSLLRKEDWDAESLWLELAEQGLLAPECEQGRVWSLAHPSLAQEYHTALPEKSKQIAHRLWLKHLGAEKLFSRFRHAWELNEMDVAIPLAIPALRSLEARGDLETLLEWAECLRRSTNSKLDRRWLHTLRAVANYRIGNHAASLESYRDWHEAARIEEPELAEIRFHLYSGLVHSAAGQVDAARRELEKSVSSKPHKKIDAANYQRRAHNLLGALAIEASDYQRARAHLAAAEKLDSNNAAILGETEQNLGLLAQAELRFTAAKEHFEKSLEQYQQAKDPQMIAIGFNCLGMLAREQGEISQAGGLLAQACQEARRGGELLQWARYEGNRALLSVNLGELAAALHSFDAAAAVLSVLGGEADRALLALGTFDIDLALGRYERAEQQLKLLSEKSLSKKGSRCAGDLTLYRARLLLARDEWTDAELEVNRFLKSRTATPAQSWEGRFLLWRCRFRQGKLAAEDIASDLQALSQMEGQAFAAWHRLWSRVTAPSSATQEFAKFRDWISSHPFPDWRREACQDLSALARGRGEADEADRFDEAAMAASQEIFEKLPEELKMEYPKIIAKPATSPEIGISESRFRQFCEINRRISERVELEEILERVMDAAIELSGAERGFLLLREKGTGKQAELKEFGVKTARRLNQETLKGEELKFSWTVVETALRQGSPLLTDNAQADERFREAKSVIQFQLKSVLALPMELNGEPFGAIYLDHRFERDCFAKQDLALLSALAVQATLAIEKARLLAELSVHKDRLETRLKDKEQQLEELGDELNLARRRLKFSYEKIVGRSQPMMRLLEQIDHVAPTKIPVWIFGESGTGKELVASALHRNSPWKNKPFVSENCSAIPENLLESELFGHKRGAFTQADRDRIGLIQQADGGTLFLDEVADMSIGMQAKLLRVLQEGTVRPLGSNAAVKVDLRLVTASNRDLEAMVREGKFRQDLFFRINGLTIALPSLHQRREDIPLLAHHLIKKIAKEYRLKASPLARDGVEWLMERNWPGNVRELESVLRAALLFAEGRRIDRKMLEGQGLGAKGPATRADSSSVQVSTERSQLVELLRRHDFDKKKVAEELGLTLKTVYNLLEKAGLPTKKSLLLRALENA